MDEKMKRIVEAALDEYEVSELEDGDLEDVAGGLIPNIDIACTDNETCPNNSGNCVAGCSCPQ